MHTVEIKPCSGKDKKMTSEPATMLSDVTTWIKKNTSAPFLLAFLLSALITATMFLKISRAHVYKNFLT